MLTTVELPGLYIQTDTGFVCSLDHVDAHIVSHGDDTAQLECHNPTLYDADVRVFAENSASMPHILGQGAALRWPVYTVPAGATRIFSVKAIS